MLTEVKTLSGFGVGWPLSSCMDWSFEEVHGEKTAKADRLMKNLKVKSILVVVSDPCISNMVYELLIFQASFTCRVNGNRSVALLTYRKISELEHRFEHQIQFLIDSPTSGTVLGWSPVAASS
jgi:hypothetical protein